MKVPKARFKKSRPAKIHVGRPIQMRGWKLPAKWTLVMRRGFDSNRERMSTVHATYDGAHEAARAYFARGWDSAEIIEKEILLPLRKRAA